VVEAQLVAEEEKMEVLVVGEHSFLQHLAEYS